MLKTGQRSCLISGKKQKKLTFIAVPTTITDGGSLIWRPLLWLTTATTSALWTTWPNETQHIPAVLPPHTSSPVPCFWFRCKTSGPFSLQISLFFNAPMSPPPLSHTLSVPSLSELFIREKRGKVGLKPTCGTVPAATLFIHTHTHTHMSWAIFWQESPLNYLTIHHWKSKSPEKPIYLKTFCDEMTSGNKSTFIRNRSPSGFSPVLD